MEDKKPWYSSHVLTSLVLIGIGIYVCVQSVAMSMPLIQKGQATYLDAPGLSPFLCGALLALLSVYILVTAIVRGGTLRFFFSKEVLAHLKSVEAIAFYKVFALLALYAFVLLPYLPYWASTSTFLFISMLVLRAFDLKNIWKNVLISLITAFALWYVFGTLFAVNLPK